MNENKMPVLEEIRKMHEELAARDPKHAAWLARVDEQRREEEAKDKVLNQGKKVEP